MKLIKLLIKHSDINSDNSFNISLVEEVYFNNTNTICWLNNAKYINTVSNSIKWNNYFLIKFDQINHNSSGNRIIYHDENESGENITYYVKVEDGHFLYSKNDTSNFKKIDYLYLDSSRNSYIFDQSDSSNSNKKIIFGTNISKVVDYGQRFKSPGDNGSYHYYVLNNGLLTSNIFISNPTPNSESPLITNETFSGRRFIYKNTNDSNDVLHTNYSIQIPTNENGISTSGTTNVTKEFILQQSDLYRTNNDSYVSLYSGFKLSSSSSGWGAYNAKTDIRFGTYFYHSGSKTQLIVYLNRGRSDGLVSNVYYAYLGLIHDRGSNDSSTPLVIENLRTLFNSYDYYFENTADSNSSFSSNSQGLGYSGYPNKVKYPFFVQTTLNGDINSGSSQLILNDSTDFPTRGYLLIDDSNPEVLYFTRSGDTCTIYKTTDSNWTIGDAGPNHNHSSGERIVNRTLRKLVAHREFTGSSDSSKFYINKNQIRKGYILNTLTNSGGSFIGHNFTSSENLELVIDASTYTINIDFDFTTLNNTSISNLNTAIQNASAPCSAKIYNTKIILLSDDINSIIIKSTSGANAKNLFGSTYPDGSNVTNNLAGSSGSGTDDINKGKIFKGDHSDIASNPSHYYEIVFDKSKMNRVDESTRHNEVSDDERSEIIWFPSNIKEMYQPGSDTTDYRSIDFITPDDTKIMDISDYFIYPGIKWTRLMHTDSNASTLAHHYGGFNTSDDNLFDDNITQNVILKVATYNFTDTNETNPDMLYFYGRDTNVSTDLMFLMLSYKKYNNQNKIGDKNSSSGINYTDIYDPHSDVSIPTSSNMQYRLVYSGYVDIDDDIIGSNTSRKYFRYLLQYQFYTDNAGIPRPSITLWDNIYTHRKFWFTTYPKINVSYNSANFTETESGTAGSDGTVTLTDIHLSNQDIVYAYSENMDVDFDEIHVINEDVLNNTDTSNFAVIKNTNNSSLVNKEYLIGQINNQRITQFSGILETNGLNNIFSNSDGRILIELLFN